MVAPQLEWRGEWADVEMTEYWCPEQNGWVDCPGPCPDGTPHQPERTTTHRMKHMHIVLPE